MSPSKAYEAVENELSNRVLALIPDNPQILVAQFSVWDLFDVAGFACRDLQPSGAQVEWALADAIRRWKEKEVTS